MFWTAGHYIESWGTLLKDNFNCIEFLLLGSSYWCWEPGLCLSMSLVRLNCRALRIQLMSNGLMNPVIAGRWNVDPGHAGTLWRFWLVKWLTRPESKKDVLAKICEDHSIMLGVFGCTSMFLDTLFCPFWEWWSWLTTFCGHVSKPPLSFGFCGFAVFCARGSNNPSFFLAFDHGCSES